MLKSFYVEIELLEMWVYSAVINFSGGACDIFKIFRNANIEWGYSSKTLCNKRRLLINSDNEHKIKKWIKTKAKQCEKLEKNVSEKKYEDGLFYEAGAFWLGYKYVTNSVIWNIEQNFCIVFFIFSFTIVRNSTLKHQSKFLNQKWKGNIIFNERYVVLSILFCSVGFCA